MTDVFNLIASATKPEQTPAPSISEEQIKEIGFEFERGYKCTHCGKVVNRESNKKWIKSYCDEAGKYVRLMLVKA